MKTKEYFENLHEEFDNYLKNNNIIIRLPNINELTEEEFTEARHMGFGASDSAKLLDVSPWGTSEDLLNEKINRISNPDINHMPSVRRGKDLEPYIINKTEKELSKHTTTPIHIFKPTHMYGRIENLLNVNFDGVIKEHNKFIPVEVKTTSMAKRYLDFNMALDIYPNNQDIFKKLLEMPASEITILDKDSIETGFPTYYYTQLQQQIDFLNAPYGYMLILYIPDWTIRIFKTSRNEEVIKEINKRAFLLAEKLQKARGEVPDDVI